MDEPVQEILERLEHAPPEERVPELDALEHRLRAELDDDEE